MHTAAETKEKEQPEMTGGGDGERAGEVREYGSRCDWPKIGEGGARKKNQAEGRVTQR